ncbi:MAG TPA: YggT family protein [Polyangiales bacterium]|nr:YggT family protein [Polyangiales bacterium]
MHELVGLFLLLLKALEFVVIADALLSWFAPNKESFPRSLTSQIADPLCAPFRALVGPERLGGMDLSPIAVILLLQVMGNVIARST